MAMIYRGNRYTIGNQPCQNMKRGEGSFPGVPNVHQCPVCWGNRTWCENCHRDHHDAGWDNCETDAFKDAEDYPTLAADVL